MGNSIVAFFGIKFFIFVLLVQGQAIYLRYNLFTQPLDVESFFLEFIKKRTHLHQLPPRGQRRLRRAHL